MTEDTHERTVSPFEKNRFFEGKLMTPRDMTVEQEYHADRLHTLARSVLGSGVVTGLSVASVSESDGDLTVTVEPGLAIDGYGRPIQVDRRTTKTLPVPDADRISLYVRYGERPVESAPAADAREDESAVNRVVEAAEVTYRAGDPPEPEESPEFDLYSLEGTEPRTVAKALTEQYHDRNRTEPEPTEDPAVPVATYERNNGEWRSTPQDFRRHAPDQELLLTALAQHLADEERHGESGGSADGSVPDRLDRLEATVADLERDRRAVATYATRRTLSARKRRFESFADRVDPHAGDVGRLARELAGADRDRLRSLATDETALRRSLEDRCSTMDEMSNSLEGVCTRESVERFRDAVSALESALEGGSLLSVVQAHDRVCERVADLSVVVSVRAEDT